MLHTYTCLLRHTPRQKNMATTTGPDVKPGQLYENFIKTPFDTKKVLN